MLDRSLRILIIDDKPSFVRVFAKRLQLKGFFVAYDTSFQNGLRHLKSETFDAVFVDVPFEDTSESQILEMFQRYDLFTKTSVFLFSSIDLNSNELSKWNASGLFSYLKKPVKLDTILNKLDDVKFRPTATSEHLSKYEANTDDSVDIHEEEATPEQLARLSQLQNSLQELEQRASQATPEQQVKEEEEATPEQLARLSQLQNSLQELEQRASETPVTTPSLSYSSILNHSDDLFQKKISIFDKLIIDLKSFKTSSVDDSSTTVDVNRVGTDDEQNNILVKELEDILSDISLLKNQIHLLDKRKSKNTSYI